MAGEINTVTNPINPVPPQTAAGDHQATRTAPTTSPTPEVTAPPHTQSSSEGTAEKDKKRPDMEELSRFLESAAALFDRNLRFEVLDDTDQVQIKVVDKVSDKVIREIPSTEVVKFQVRFRDMVGMLLDQEM